MEVDLPSHSGTALLPSQTLGTGPTLYYRWPALAMERWAKGTTCKWVLGLRGLLCTVLLHHECRAAKAVSIRHTVMVASGR